MAVEMLDADDILGAAAGTEGELRANFSGGVRLVFRVLEFQDHRRAVVFQLMLALNRSAASPPPQLRTPAKAPSSGNPKLVWGIILGVPGFALDAIALLVGLWARAHSPHMGFGEMLTKLDSYYLKEPVYNAVMAIVVLAGLAGFCAIAELGVAQALDLAGAGIGWFYLNVRFCRRPEIALIELQVRRAASRRGRPLKHPGRVRSPFPAEVLSRRKEPARV